MGRTARLHSFGRSGDTPCNGWPHVAVSPPPWSSSAYDHPTLRERDLLNWSELVDLDRALRNVEHDAYGDWYRDPWGWPEVAWAVKHRPEIVAARLNGTGARPTLALTVPKEQFGMRPAVVLDPIDRLAGQALTDRLLPELYSDTHSWVFGWRPNRADPERGSYVKNSGEWDRYRSYLRQCSEQYEFALRADIASFFPSIDLGILGEKLRVRSRQLAPLRRLESFLHGVASQPGNAGLPQRCLSSSSLANMYLADIDAVLDVRPELDETFTTNTAVRWMDDYWIFSTSEAWLRSTQVALASALRADGLDLNSGKTSLLRGEEIGAAIDTFSHSGAEPSPITGRTMLPIRQVAELVDGIAADPASTSRSNIYFTARSVADLEMKPAAIQLIHVSSQLPHGADHLARMARKLKLWDGPYLDFLEDHLQSQWPKFSWSLGQYATGVPSTVAAGKGKRVRGLFGQLAEIASTSDDLTLTTAVLSRYAEWDKDIALQLATSVVRRSNSALQYRACALFMRAAGASKSEVRRILSSHEENFATLLMLEDTGWAKIPVEKDYSGRQRP
ncbi:RNA-directed DNA polymerase [Aquihabitans sp. G128]|uniref:RNA-directed DNA polymerase n=1 Tax=Aquihabitans sp. G128 TaxID=2849779 RepID=UPI001C216735|nr:RNA-directed DNA polymerase [Aquihabitans sp. G128]QXC59914.1 RNA-directed DNA polymerase [Aquihabitans sp. G128]